MKLPYLVAATFFMEYLDTTIIATALPQMAESFGVGAKRSQYGHDGLYARTRCLHPYQWLDR